MKHVLITAGSVPAPLDANKLVSNRVRGLWALKFARYLAQRGHQVTLLVPDLMTRVMIQEHTGSYPLPGTIMIRHQKGFWDYQKQCLDLAPQHDAAVMAAAVVNWIPAEPYPGKMPTKGFKEGDIIQIPFVLAPHVIDQMKVVNPKITLIGCKMLVNAPEDELIDAAYGVLLKAKCNAVIANDMGTGLKRKLIVNQDRTVQAYDNDFDGFYANLLGHIEDEHFKTVRDHREGTIYQADCWNANGTFDRLVQQYRGRFMRVEGGRVFGACAVTTSINGGARLGWLVSPREKGEMFTSEDATLVTEMDLKQRTVMVPPTWDKPTLNAPLLIRMAQKYQPKAVLHLHEQLPGVPTMPYAPPGTVRDNEREIPGPVFNIEGHGFIACLDNNLNIWKVPE